MGSEVRGGVTPDVGHAVGCAATTVLGTEREVGVALLRGGRVLGQELHDVWVVGVAPQAAATDDVHDARQHVAGAAAHRPHPPGATTPRPSGHLLLLARVQDLQVGGDRVWLKADSHQNCSVPSHTKREQQASYKCQRLKHTFDGQTEQCRSQCVTLMFHSKIQKHILKLYSNDINYDSLPQRFYLLIHLRLDIFIDRY